MPRVRVVVIVCDPLGLFEKNFFKTVWCHHDVAAAVRRHDKSGTRHPDAPCERSIAVALHQPGYLDLGLVPHLQDLHEQLGQRALVFHQETLREHPKEVFDNVTSFIGITSFPPWFRYRRYNSRKGHRSDLCRNKSLAHALKWRLAPEYRAIEEALAAAGADITREVRRRKNRCDREEELDDRAPRCVYNGAPCPW